MMKIYNMNMYSGEVIDYIIHVDDYTLYQYKRYIIPRLDLDAITLKRIYTLDEMKSIIELWRDKNIPSLTVMIELCNE